MRTTQNNDYHFALLVEALSTASQSTTSYSMHWPFLTTIERLPRSSWTVGQSNHFARRARFAGPAASPGGPLRRANRFAGLAYKSDLRPRNVIHPLIGECYSAVSIAGKTSVREKADEA